MPDKNTADILFNYLRDVIYDSSNAKLDPNSLPEEFQDLGKGLMFFANAVLEMTELAKNLADGDLDCKIPPSSNEIAAPLKTLHAALKHLTWQAQQVANGDYSQRVAFMGDFSEAFNNMIMQLERRRKIRLDKQNQLEQYMRLMLFNYPDPILLFDSEKKLVYVSNLFYSQFGIPETDKIIGSELYKLLITAGLDAHTDFIVGMYERAVWEKRTVAVEHDIESKDGNSVLHYQIQIAPMFNNDGNAAGAMMLLHDRTEIVSAQREAERAREAEYARENAEKSSRAKTDFLSRMSHEIRTPMNAIIGMAAVYQGTDDISRKDYCVDKIGEASKHLLGVINDILDMSKIEANKLELSPGNCDFRKMIERASGIVMFKIEERKQRLTVHIDDGIPGIIMADDQRLVQVITNLLSNAVKFTPEGGEISLKAEKESEDERGCTLRFEVKDTGIGISKEQQEHLFDPFEQADGSISRRFGGTGLGLAISKRIVEMMRGNIRVESEIGKGAAFIFEITVGKAEASASIQTKADAAEQNASTEPVDFSGKRLLLAEDVSINRELLIALLEDTGIEIDCAEDGEDALNKVTAAPESYDLVLMDIQMPKMDGYEATKRIRASGLPGTEALPIIAMTASVFREDIERCIASGMNGHLGKPINIGEVIARLKEYL